MWPHLEGGLIRAKKRRHTPEQVIGRPHEAEVELAKGTAIGRVCKDLGATEPTYYRRRKECGGMKPDRAGRLEELEKEDARPRRLPADAESDKAITKEAGSGEVPAEARPERTLGRSEHAREVLGPDRAPRGARACRVPGQCRATQRRTPIAIGRQWPPCAPCPGSDR